MASHRLLLTNLALIVIGVGVTLSQTSVQDYLLSRSPRERLMNHWKEFENKMGRDREIRHALEGMFGSDRSANLQELSRRGTARLDNTALLERARLMSTLYSQLSDRTCASIVRGSLTENGRAEFELALLKLEAGFASEWME